MRLLCLWKGFHLCLLARRLVLHKASASLEVLVQVELDVPVEQLGT